MKEQGPLATDRIDQTTMTLCCAIYARYSSDLQNPTSITDQVRNCRDHAEQRGWAVLEEHAL